MLWSLVMQSHKKYSQRVEEPFHVTMASLDITKTDEPVTQVMVVFGGNTTRYLLCSLSKKNVWQVPLNLHMEKGTFVTLSCNGGGYVHLTGYYKNPKLSDPNAVISKVISAHIHEGLNTIDDTKDYLKQNREKVEYQRIIHGSWLVQKINAEEENQENGRKAKSKRKANSQEDQAAKRTKPSANSNENRSNDDDCDQNIENLGKLIENNNYYAKNGDSSDCDETEGDSDYDEEEDESDYNEEEDESDYDGYSSSFYSDTTYVSTSSGSSGCDSDNDDIKMQSEEDTSQREEKNEKQKQEKKVTGEEAVEKQKDKKKKKRELRGINKWVLSSGVRVKRLKPGTGKVAEVGKFVTTYYLACFMHGVEVTKLNHCLDGRGYRFKLGAGYVPHGVDEGIVGMKVGEKRRLLIPPRMLGKRSGGAKLRVPPCSTFVYDVELIKVE